MPRYEVVLHAEGCHIVEVDAADEDAARDAARGKAMFDQLDGSEFRFDVDEITEVDD